jgi:hypothetical protein
MTNNLLKVALTPSPYIISALIPPPPEENGILEELGIDYEIKLKPVQENISGINRRIAVYLH